jgi:flagellar biosynthetic protein FliR
MINILLNDFVVVLFIFLRVAAIFFVAPFFGNTTIPNTIRIFLSLVIAYIIFFSVKGFTFEVNKGLLPLALYGIKEIVTGLIIGFSVNLIFYGIAYAGLLIGFDMGLTMASAFDPSTQMESNILGQLLNFTALIIFISINQSLLEILVKYSAGVFILAVKIASPFIISFFLIQVAAGIIARVIPQMQVFFVVLPLQIIVGYLLLAAFSPIVVYVIKTILENYENGLFELIKVMVN